MPRRAYQRGQVLPLIVLFLSGLLSVAGATWCAQVEHSFMHYRQPTFIDRMSGLAPIRALFSATSRERI